MRHCKSTSSPNHDGQIAFRSELIMYNSYFIPESKQTSTDAAWLSKSTIVRVDSDQSVETGGKPPFGRKMKIVFNCIYDKQYFCFIPAVSETILTKTLIAEAYHKISSLGFFLKSTERVLTKTQSLTLIKWGAYL